MCLVCVCVCPCQQKRAARLPSAAPGSIKRGGPRNALGYRPEPEVLPCQQKRAARLPSAVSGSIKGGGPETRSGTVQSLQGGGGPNQVLRLAASREGGPETRLGTVQSPPAKEGAPKRARVPSSPASRNEPRGPETRSGTVQSLKSGTVQSLKCCPCQQKRAARLPSAAPGSIKRGGRIKGGAPETRSGTVQSLKCCPCQQKRAARLSSAASRRGEPSAAPGSIKGEGGPRNALLYRPEPEVLPLPAETSCEAPKCCAWQHQEGGPETRSGTVQSLKCCPCQQKRAARLPSAAASRGGAPKRARVPSRA